jgi:amino acid transporter
MQPSAQPGFIPGVPAGQPIQPITKLPTAKKPSKKLPLIIAGSLVGLLVIITVGAVLLSGGDKQPVQQNTNQTQGLEGPQPAAAIDVEQANNAITQDVTGHDNTKDFPDDMLTDQSLGL